MRSVQKASEIPSYDFWKIEEQQMMVAQHVIESTDKETVFFTPHKIPHFVLTLIKCGEGLATIDHLQYIIKDHTLFIGSPDHIRTIDIPSGVKFERYQIAFKKEFFSLMGFGKESGSVISSFSKFPVYALNDEEFENIERIFKSIISFFDKDSTNRNKIIASLAASILFFVLEKASQNFKKIPVRQQRYFNIYREFLEQLEGNFQKLHFTSDYAALMFIPDKRLNRACKATSGKTTGKIISNRIDLEAKKLLFYSTYTIKEIGYDLGFKEPSHFIKFFKSMNSITPLAFRNKISQNT